ncbi:MAG: sulfotransferase [Desulfovibrio sp.]|uniref:sulfotransferase n=1 Tax=Desulfovibrio sp. 7SRBS1 TaxID=3378064 RepID=UPI003B3E2CF2
MSSDVVILAEKLNKCYFIYDKPQDRLFQMLTRGKKRFYHEFWALKDVSFEVTKGEIVGVIGQNGCGKSTLLQMVCGTLASTRGKLETKGRIAALLELGIGFNPDFTGRENVFLNGALFGFSEEEMNERLAEITAFADIGEFLDQPVKTYSSGMTVRLAFAVATHVEADILLIDEALSVGDAAFQFKCLKHMENLRRKGITILFVSHDMSLVQSFCSRAIYLQHGEVKADGHPEAVAAQYFFDTREQHRRALGLKHPLRQQTPLGNPPEAAAFGNGMGEIVDALFSEEHARQIQMPLGAEVRLNVELRCPPDEDVALAVAIQNHRLVEVSGRRFALEANGHAHRRVQITLPGVFAPGDYFVTLRLVQQITHIDYLPLQSQIAALHFQVIDPKGEQDFLGLCRTAVRLEELPSQPLRVVALLAVRNEELYMERCIRHLVEQGVEVLVIDNDSTDATAQIAREWLGKGVIGIENYPFEGFYDWKGLLEFKARLAQSVEADWFIHHDADEIRQSRREGETLVQALTRLDGRGYNAINFDEYVFLPQDRGGLLLDKALPGTDYVADFPLAYYFAPTGQHRINAWKKNGHPVDLAGSGGHRVSFPNLRLAPERLVLRHYPCLSKEHLEAKYGAERVYSREEVEKLGWHGDRVGFKAANVSWPQPEKLLSLEDGWPTDRIWTGHPFLGKEHKVLRPVPFVVGVGRSGTTLARLMLDAHPELSIPSETMFLAGLLDSPPASVEEFTNAVTQCHTWGDFHISEDELRTALDKLESFSLGMAVRTFYQLYAAKQGKTRWGDKTPPYGQYVDRIADILPEARFIHMVRDGRDVALSYQDKWFGPEDKSMSSMATFWEERICLTRRLAESLPADRYMEVRFEDLVMVPEETLHRICDFLHLPFDAAMLDYHQKAQERLEEMQDHESNGQQIAAREDLLRIHKNTLRPPDPGQIGKWKNALDAADIATFESIAGDLLRDFNYELVTENVHA